ncbi:MAG: hypothetical protein ACM3OG_11405 [Actinomycetota bacterium]
MKANLVRFAVLVVAAVTMAMPTFVGQAEAAQGTTPDSNDWQYREALETGNLSSGQVDLKKAMNPAKNVQTVEYDGVVYRVGIDTP